MGENERNLVETAIAFSFGGNLDVRVIRREGRNWFVAVDVCAALGLGDCPMALAGIDDRRKSTVVPKNEPSGHTELTVVDEAGLRALIRAGRNPKAVQPFRRWVATELLPSLERMSVSPAVPGRTSEQRNPIHESETATAEASPWNGPLIPVFTATIGGIEHLVCNARDLHRFLAVGRDFSTWIKERISEYGFEEDNDYIVIDSPNSRNQKGRGGDRRGKDYHLTLDMAKEVAAFERSEQGRRVRRHLIDCERRITGERLVEADKYVAEGSTESGASSGLDVQQNPASPFRFDDKDIRVIRTGDELWVVAKDVAEALGYSWNGMQRIAHVPEEWRGVTSVVTPSGAQDMAVLSEQGLYFFLARSDKPKAIPFQKWLAGEVLPAIRRTGRYDGSKARTSDASSTSCSLLDLWVYDGPPANQQLKIFDIPAVQGGYVMLFGLSSGGTMLCSASVPSKHVGDTVRMVGRFGLQVTRVLVSKQHIQYSLLKSKLAKVLEDVPRINNTYPQTDIESLKRRVEEFLEAAYERYAPRWEKPSEQMVDAKAKVVSALEELVEAIRAWQIG